MPDPAVQSIWGKGPYPPPAFHFQVVFTGDPSITDTAFQEVSGIGATLDTEPYHEGGENSFLLQLPTGMSHPKLVLKRGVATTGSKLVAWCRSVLEEGFVAGINTKSLHISLLDENHAPVRVWSLENAYPVGWEVESFNATKNEVAIEKIELHYSRVTRIK
jgi:phage tail-like protein